MKHMQQNPATVDYDTFGRILSRMNPAVHGVEGGIRHGGNANSYYDDPPAAGTLFSA